MSDPIRGTRLTPRAVQVIKDLVWHLNDSLTTNNDYGVCDHESGICYCAARAALNDGRALLAHAEVVTHREYVVEVEGNVMAKLDAAMDEAARRARADLNPRWWVRAWRWLHWKPAHARPPLTRWTDDPNTSNTGVPWDPNGALAQAVRERGPLPRSFVGSMPDFPLDDWSCDHCGTTVPQDPEPYKGRWCSERCYTFALHDSRGGR